MMLQIKGTTRTCASFNCTCACLRPHRCLLALLGQACLAAAVWGVWGLPGLVVHVVAGVVAQLYLSDVDYLLHYGLERPSVVGDRNFVQSQPEPQM